MTSIILFFIAYILLMSFTGAVSLNSAPQEKWELAKRSGRTLNSKTSGAAIELQEFYLLNDSDSFTKARTRNGKAF